MQIFACTHASVCVHVRVRACVRVCVCVFSGADIDIASSSILFQTNVFLLLLHGNPYSTVQILVNLETVKD